MFHSELLEISDRSYYADRLEALTGRHRSAWANLPLPALREVLKKIAQDKGIQEEEGRYGLHH